MTQACPTLERFRLRRQLLVPTWNQHLEKEKEKTKLLGSKHSSQVLRSSHAGSGKRSSILFLAPEWPRSKNVSLICIHVVVLERFDAILFDPSAAIVVAEPPTANLMLFPNVEGQTVCRERGIDRARNVL